MSEPYVAEVRTFAFSYAPAGWLPCDGRELEIAHNPALFALLGTTFGGDGEASFALPKLPPLESASGALGYYIAVAGTFPPRD